MYYCGIDIGTTNTKAILIDDDLRIVSRYHGANSCSLPGKKTHAGDWYRDFCKAMDYFAEQGCFKDRPIFCSLTGQGGSFALLNGRFQPVSRAWLWTERGRTEIARKLAEGLGGAWFYHTTGWDVSSSLVAAKLADWKERGGRKFAKGKWIGGVPEFILAQLTGQWMTDITNAQITGLCDFEKGRWSGEILDYIGLSADMLPPIVSDLRVLCEDISTPWGTLTFGTSSHDQYAAMKAAGLEADRSMLLATGTAWVINRKTSRPVFDDTGYMSHPGRDFTEGGYGNIIGLSQIGQIFERLLARLGIDSSQLSDLEAGFDPQGFPRQRYNELVPEEALDAEQKIRRFMEWSASRLEYVLEKLQLTKGLEKLMITGGAAQNSFLPQVIADLTGIVVETIEFPEFTAYGAALMAREIATGENSGGRIPAAAAIRRFEPKHSREYRDWFHTYQYEMFDKSYRELTFISEIG